MAGLSICVVMIPSVMAYAELVHLPPVTGLYAALAACIGYALFASSRQVIAGPDAAIGLLAVSVILPLARGDAGRLAVLAAELALLSGALLLLLATQLGKLFGISTEGDAFIPQIQSLLSQLHTVHPPRLALGLGLIMLLWGLACGKGRCSAFRVAARQLSENKRALKNALLCHTAEIQASGDRSY